MFGKYLNKLNFSLHVNFFFYVRPLVVVFIGKRVEFDKIHMNVT